MATLRLHSKVTLWYGRLWAVQHIRQLPEWSLGVHIEWQRPLVDVFVGGWTFALGAHPLLTDPRTANRHACRGFLMGEYPEDAIL